MDLGKSTFGTSQFFSPENKLIGQELSHTRSFEEVCALNISDFMFPRRKLSYKF